MRHIPVPPATSRARTSTVLRFHRALALEMHGARIRARELCCGVIVLGYEANEGATGDTHVRRENTP